VNYSLTFSKVQMIPAHGAAGGSPTDISPTPVRSADHGYTLKSSAEIGIRRHSCLRTGARDLAETGAPFRGAGRNRAILISFSFCSYLSQPRSHSQRSS
jgi:hypothetical protein